MPPNSHSTERAISSEEEYTPKSAQAQEPNRVPSPRPRLVRSGAARCSGRRMFTIEIAGSRPVALGCGEESARCMSLLDSTGLVDEIDKALQLLKVHLALSRVGSLSSTSPTTPWSVAGVSRISSSFATMKSTWMLWVSRSDPGPHDLGGLSVVASKPHHVESLDGRRSTRFALRVWAHQPA